MVISFVLPGAFRVPYAEPLKLPPIGPASKAGHRAEAETSDVRPVPPIFEIDHGGGSAVLASAWPSASESSRPT